MNCAEIRFRIFAIIYISGVARNYYIYVFEANGRVPTNAHCLATEWKKQETEEEKIKIETN